MRTPLPAHQPAYFLTFAAGLSLGLVLALLVLGALLGLAWAQPAAYSAPGPAVQFIAPAVAQPAVVADDSSALHFESATHSAGVYDVVPVGQAAHDPESGAATTGTLIYREP